MRLKGILTERHFKPYASFQIVTEWEDRISHDLGLPVKNVNKKLNFLFRRFIQFKLEWLFLKLDSIRPVKNYYLHFSMQAQTYLTVGCLKNVIPVIIDFWLTQHDLELFYKTYSNCKLLLISSKEVYDYLKTNNCPLHIEHLPLSIPDKYISEQPLNGERRIDFLFAGRRDPVFFDYVKRYNEDFPDADIEWVYKEPEGYANNYISNKKGELKEDFSSREGYKKLLQGARITFYSTPGMDEAKKGANGYNQVTPRFLELISAGCLVMGRYPSNSDVDFYDMNRICPGITSYDDFKRVVTLFSDRSFVQSHLKTYQPYLISHATSNRSMRLKEILEKNQISYAKK